MKILLEIPDCNAVAVEAVRTAMKDAEVFAFVIVVGLLLPHSDRAKERMLAFVSDSLAERNEAKP